MPHAAPAFALSVRQPFAWLICQGIKPVENRTWRTHYRGRLAIHAGGKPAPDFLDLCDRIAEEFGVIFPAELPLGGIVGEATLTDCVTSHASPWFTGPFGFTLAEARPVKFVEMPGELGVFRL